MVYSEHQSYEYDLLSVIKISFIYKESKLLVDCSYLLQFKI